MRSRWAVFAVVLGLLAIVSPASAQVVIDPDSPSAKEYAIPLETERRQADPESTTTDEIAHGERSSPLFGAGIEDDDDRAPRPSKDDDDRAPRPRGGERSSRDGGAGGGRGGGAGDATGSNSAPEIVRAGTANPGAPGGGIGAPLTIAALALAVVALGGGAGMLLRRRRA